MIDPSQLQDLLDQREAQYKKLFEQKEQQEARMVRVTALENAVLLVGGTIEYIDNPADDEQDSHAAQGVLTESTIQIANQFELYILHGYRPVTEVANRIIQNLWAIDPSEIDDERAANGGEPAAA